MASGDNPFAAQDNPFDSADANPFAAVPPGEVTSDTAALTGAMGGTFEPYFDSSSDGTRSANPFVSGAPSAQTNAPVAAKPGGSGGASVPATAKEAELARKERDLERRQAELQRREAQLPAGSQKNFPKFYPLVYHNIEEEIPLDKQRVVRIAFYSYLGLVLCLSVNWFAVTCELFRQGATETSAWLYAGIYVVTGVFGAWYLWYSRLYHACKGDRGLTFFFFFMAYSVHCSFCLWASLAPPGLLGADHAFCGIFSMFEMYAQNGFIGFMYMLGMFCWIFETVLSGYVMRSSYRMFRGSGHSAESVQGEARRAGLGAML